jgi:hypothetical protein
MQQAVKLDRFSVPHRTVPAARLLRGAVSRPVRRPRSAVIQRALAAGTPPEPAADEDRGVSPRRCEDETGAERALKSRDGGCRFPGCDRTRFTEGHHVRHWADGGETNLANLVTLCTYHHRVVHEGGFGLRVTHDGVFVFTRPDGSRVGANGSLPVRFRGSASPQRFIDELLEQNLSRDIRIDSSTARCRWLGVRMDYSWAVGDLIQLRDQRASSA